MKNIFNKNPFIKAVLAYFIGTLLVKGIGVITTPIFTRILSQTDYGILSIFQTWVNCFAIFIGLQVSGSIATARVHLPMERFSLYLKNVLILSILSFIGISTVCFIFWKPIAALLELPEQLIPFLLIQSFGSSCAVFYLSYTIQTKQPKKNIYFSVFLALSNVTISIPLILGLHENKYMGRIIAGTLIYIIISFYVYYVFLTRSKGKINREDWKYAIPLSIPLIAHLLSNVLIGQSDRLFIAKYLGFDEAAIYSVAYTLGSIGIMITEASNNVWSPWYLDNTKSGKHAAIENRSKIYIICVIVVFTWLMLCAPEIMRIMAPAGYIRGTESFIVVSIAIYFKFLYRFPLAYEQYAKNLKWVALSTMICLGINILFNFLLIPTYGMLGAAVSTLITYIGLFAFHEFIARIIIKGYNISFNNYLPGLLIVTITGTCAFFFINYLVVRLAILLLFTFIIIGYLLYNKNGLNRQFIFSKLSYLKEKRD